MIFETSKNYILLKKYDYKLWRECVEIAIGLEIDLKSSFDPNLLTPLPPKLERLPFVIESSIINLLVKHLKEKNLIKDYENDI